MKAGLVGEAWGLKEELFGHAFIWSSGMELARMGAEGGLFHPLIIKCRGCTAPVQFGRCSCGTYNAVNEIEMKHFWKEVREQDDVAVTNVFYARPDANNVELFFGPRNGDVCLDLPPLRPGKFLLKSMRHHLEALLSELEVLQPNIIVALGNTPCWALGLHPKISEIRGTVAISPVNKFKVLPTWHPAYVLRTFPVRPIVVADLKKAAGEASTPSTNRTSRWITVNPSLPEIEAWLKLPGSGTRAVDIESGYALYTKPEIHRMSQKQKYRLASQISMVGFARDPHEILVIPFMTRNSPDLNYWPTPAEESFAWNLVQLGVDCDQDLVYQNGIYDIGRLLAHGIRPKRNKHDTMLRHHANWPEMRKGLGFILSVQANEIAWKTMYGLGESLKRDD